MGRGLHFLFALCLLFSCASSRYARNGGHDLFKEGKFLEAAKLYQEAAEETKVNKLLFKLDAATAFFNATRYDEAIKLYLEAEEIAKIKDYTSITEEAGTLLTSDNIRTYKGEDFEKVLINAYLAMAFAAQGKEESAQVEARKINQSLYRMIHEGKAKYEESAFARYLSAMLWESSGEYDSAYIDYKKAYDLDPNFPGVVEDLMGMALKNGFTDRYQKWKKTFSNLEARKMAKGYGELVVLFQSGLGPIKVPRDGNSSMLPKYIRRNSVRLDARVRVGAKTSKKLQTALDIEDVSHRFLEDKINRLAALKLAGVAAKGAVAIGVGKATENSDIGQLAFIALMATERADTRCWRTLPAQIKMIRLPLKAGKYPVQVDVLGVGDGVVETRNFEEIQINASKIRFLVVR